MNTIALNLLGWSEKENIGEIAYVCLHAYTHSWEVVSHC